MIDRLIHHSDVIRIEGESYRIKDRKTKNLTQSQE
ncbi:MAG: ATP-binding protein [Elusimicrobiota bacterium]